MHNHVHLSGCDGASEGSCTCEVRRYQLIALLTFVIVLVQGAGSYFSGSLSLSADTMHVALDFAAAFISIFVALRARRHANPQALRVFWMRVSGGLLLGGLLIIAYEAFDRLRHPQVVAGPIVMLVALIGGVMNYGQLRLVPHDHTATAQAQRLHAIGDLTTSIAVFIGGIAMWGTGDKLIDPLLSLLIVAFVGLLTLRMLFWPKRQGHCGHGH